jgi:anti-sigma-K factor RskA
MHDELNELLPLHALGALDTDDRDRVESHLATGCAQCVEQLVELYRTAASLAWAAPPAVPPAGLRDRIMGTIAAERPSHEPIPFRARRAAEAPRSATGAFVAVAALLAAAGIAIFFLVSALLSTRSQLDGYVRQVAEVRQESQKTAEELARAKRILDVVNDPEVRFTRLSTTTATPDPDINVVWQPSTRRGLIFAKNLPKTEAGKAYELWLIAADSSVPIPAAVFNTDAAGNAVVAIDQLPATSTPKTFAITVEPAGGSSAPTTTPILAGNYTGA